MLTHTEIWTAIDRLAQQYGLSPSGLARRAGLDPTTFNRSKRSTREGKARWPSTESISKILEATGCTLQNFLCLLENGNDVAPPGGLQTVPLANLQQMQLTSHFDPEGTRIGEGWDIIPLPHLGDPRSYAVEISGNDYLPDYRDGDVLLVSPGAQPRRGDRILVGLRSGGIGLHRFHRQSLRNLELQPLQGDVLHSVPLTDVALMARVVWASQ